MRTVSAAALAAILLATAPALAEPVAYSLPEDTARLKPGPGVEVAEAYCQSCHSLDYIAMQPPKKGEAFWSAAVTKMVKVFGAQIPEDDQKTIAAYLAKTY